VPSGGARRQEVGGDARGDGLDDVPRREVCERHALHVGDGDRLEGDVEATCARRDRVRVPDDGVLVERVDFRRVGDSPGVADVARTASRDAPPTAPPAPWITAVLPSSSTSPPFVGCPL